MSRMGRGPMGKSMGAGQKANDFKGTMKTNCIFI